MGKPLHLTIQSDVFVILGVTILLCLAVIALSKKIDKTDPLAKPHGLVLLAIMLVETLDNQVKDNVGPRIAKNLSPYVTTIAIYIFLSNILGLFGFSSPTPISQSEPITQPSAMIALSMTVFSPISTSLMMMESRITLPFPTVTLALSTEPYTSP